MLIHKHILSIREKSLIKQAMPCARIKRLGGIAGNNEFTLVMVRT
ncbi:MAG: hypothetical protein IGNPGNKH_00330 [Sodalis sp. Ffu]|nr:MAG: hypothetical protein IGNPGNKH_00330 [Sodalis sp. Ffu]